MSNIIRRALALECACEMEEAQLGQDAEAIEIGVNQVNQDQTDASNLLAGVDKMEEVEATATAVVEPGEPVPPETTRMIEIAMESIYRSMKIKPPARMALEAEDGKPSGTTILEHVREAIRKLIAAIAQAVRKAVAWVGDLIASMSEEAARLEMAALTLNREVLPLLPISAEKVVKVSPQLSKRLYVPFGTTVSGVSDVSVFVSAAAKSALGDHLDKLAAGMDKLITNPQAKNLDEMLAGAIEDAYSGVFQRDVRFHLGVEAPMGCKLYITNHMVGGNVAMGIIPDNADGLRHLKFFSAKGELPDTVPDLIALNRGEAGWMLKHVISMMATVRQFQGRKAKLNDFSRKLDATLKRVNDVKAEFPEETRKFIKDVLHVAPVLVKGLHTEAFKIGINVSRAALDYVVKSKPVAA